MFLPDWLAAKRGRIAMVARETGLPQSFISKIASGVKPIPADRCPTFERITAREVTCEEMRPDVEWHVLRGVSAIPLGGSDAGIAAEIPGAPRASANDETFTGAPAPEAA